MKNIYIPPTPEAYQDDLARRAFSDRNIANNEFYKKLIGWVVSERTPILYEQDHDDEYANFSINANWLLLRDYGNTSLGNPDTIATMYALHEFTHMTHQLPTRLDLVSASEYANAFTASEYRASNETEILIHYRIPELRKMVLQGVRIAADILKERYVNRPSSKLLGILRPLVIETEILDHLFTTDEDKAVLDRMKSFNGNQQWALDRYNAIKPYFSDPNITQSHGLTDDEYEQLIENDTSALSQEDYEANIVRNVMLGYAMCGLAVPAITTFEEAVQAAKNLEGKHAVVQS